MSMGTSPISANSLFRYSPFIRCHSNTDRKTAACSLKPLHFRQEFWETDDHFSVNRPARTNRNRYALSLPFGFPVVFCACQREQEPEQASEKFSMPSEIAIALCPVFYYNVTWKNEKATSFLSNLIVLCPCRRIPSPLAGGCGGHNFARRIRKCWKN